MNALLTIHVSATGHHPVAAGTALAGAWRGLSRGAAACAVTLLATAILLSPPHPASAEDALMKIDAGGNVGIGPQKPATRLDVNGGGWFRTAPPGRGLDSSAGEGVRVWHEKGKGGQIFAWDYSTNKATNLLLQRPGGNVGIGTPTPGFPLTFPNTNGEKISLYGQKDISYGFAVRDNLLQIHTDQSNSDIAFGYATSGEMEETMRIKGNGMVGIGTKTPGAKLQVAGSGFFGDDSGSLLPSAGTGVRVFYEPSTDGGHIYAYDYESSSKKNLILQSPGGNVGIGINDPKAPLHVKIGSGVASYGIFANALSTAWKEDTKNPQQSIIAEGGIQANMFHARSDERIKNIIGQSNSSHDLDTLLAIRITDYTEKDVVKTGSTAQKKVIAQQVEKVFPQAVSKHTDVVPDIYQTATIQDGWVALATDLKKGERVKLIGDKAEGVHEVLEVTKEKFRTGFKPEGDKVFVFGREVDDFRTVDYDAIAMLNVSATQQIKQELDAEVAEVQALKAENAALRARLDALESKVTSREGQ